MTKPRVEVLCLTYGEPAEHQWRAQYEYSLSILNRLTRRVAPIPGFITPLLAARRGRIRVQTFSEKGYHSPLEKISAAQAAKIEEHLRAKDPSREYRATMVMEFRPPFVWDFLEKMRADPPDEIILLPLYVAESDFTTGISRTDLKSFDARHTGKHGLPRPAYVGGFGFEERMGKLLADFVWGYCLKNGWTTDQTRDAALILGAHGTLQYPPEGINSGARETLYLFGLIRKHLKDRFRTVRVGWLNHTIGGKWTFPAVDEAAQECQNQGIKRVVYFPFGFMGDNAESQIEGADALAEFTWDGLLYLPCPNDDDRFCALLAEMTIERLNDPMREEWSALEQGGRRDLIQKERPAPIGPSGLLRFNSPTLAAMVIGLWLALGSFLLARAVLASNTIESPMALGIAAFCAAGIGYYKGTRVFARLIKRNLLRLRRLPQPSPLSKLFGSTSYYMIVIMACFGISLGVWLRYMGWMEAYVAILGGVGISMIWGAVTGIFHFADARPKMLVSMQGPVDPRALQARKG